MQPQNKDKVRIFALARELGMESKDLLTLCQDSGLDIKNQLSTIGPEVRDQILALVKRGNKSQSTAPATPAPAPTPAPVVPPQNRVMKNLDVEARQRQPRPEPARQAPTPTPTPVPAATPAIAPVATVTAQASPSNAASGTQVVAPTPTPVPAPPPTPAIVPAPAPTPTPVVAAPAPTPQPVAPPPTPTQPVAQVAPPVVKPTPVTPPSQTPQQTKPTPPAQPTHTPKQQPQQPAKQPQQQQPKGTQPNKQQQPQKHPAPPQKTSPPNQPPKQQQPPVPPAAPQHTTPTPTPVENKVIPQEKIQTPAVTGPTPASKPTEAAPRATETPPTTPTPETPAKVQPPQRPAEQARPAATQQQPPRPQQPAQEQPRPAAGPIPSNNRNPMRQLPSGPQRQGGGGGQGGNNQQRQGGGGNNQGNRNNQGGGQSRPQGQNQGGGNRQGGQGGNNQGDRRNQGGGNNRNQGGNNAGGNQNKQGPQDQKKQPEKPAAPAAHGGARKIAEIPPELLEAMQKGDRTISVKEIEDRLKANEKQAQNPRGAGNANAPATPATDDEFEGERKGAKGNKRGGGPTPGAVPAAAGGIPGRADRHKERTERQVKRKGTDEGRGGSSKPISLGDDERERHIKNRRPKIKPQGTIQRKGKTPITLPITVRSLSEAIGRKVGEVQFKLLSHGMAQTTTINSQVEPEVAELVALEFNCELEVKRDVDVEGDLVRVSKQADKPEDLVPRAPIVVIMGHVDHGKTSLLDRIRRSNIVDTEAGGITQVIRAWRVEHAGRPVTFLDTPGHEAFTKMRARGANVTDIAVIVVAANDGVKPQTEEAISHAKAAGVSIVVAINKVDLPDANLRKTEQQLYGLDLVPDTMGGDVQFVQTSAKTGKGIDDLLEALSLRAELKELKANPNKPASGTCLEAHLSEKEGVQATVLVQDGTLKPGDIVLCGATYGTVRRMYDDHNRVCESAGPSVPVRIIGLDSVPNADDPFMVVQDVATARDIAEDRMKKLLARAQVVRAPMTVDSLAMRDTKIAELKVILKAEARGSIEAIRNELEKLQHDEVRVKLLHAAIGGINASDVQLAMTSPEDTLIVGFNVVPDNEAKTLAEERGIKINEYNIIYKLADDIRSALEGKLKPREEIVYLGRANVRETFKISRVGTIAGCFVTQGVIDRSAKIRVIRSGVVVYPPVDKTAGLDSLKRFKDDVREVREGFECGIKLAGYDDIKVNDVIEAYRVEQVQRTLS